MICPRTLSQTAYPSATIQFCIGWKRVDHKQGESEEKADRTVLLIINQGPPKLREMVWYRG